jgi:hypothetical protein
MQQRSRSLAAIEYYWGLGFPTEHPSNEDGLEYLRGNALSHQIWETYEDIVEACRNARNSLMHRWY